MPYRFLYVIFLMCVVCFGTTLSVYARTVQDSDEDGLQDHDEIKYGTDKNNSDSDGDGYRDGIEARNGYSPLSKKGVRLRVADSDHDGLTDEEELLFGTDPANADTDEDGFSDRKELEKGYNPLSTDRKKLKKRIEVDISEQRLTYYLGDITIRSTQVSTGKQSTPTPVGEFAIMNKSPRAWSRIAKLWMPYWMGFAGGKYGLHELPEWPGGKKEGANHLGIPVSGGCVRLGIGEAKKIYDWTSIGTKLIIRK
ncbi:L,D-transpeptidase [Candidatus Uhrbacteria bacterium]|nr:L,D-transpeptidase [Candidatus Uhrbacteria bacterium]